MAFIPAVNTAQATFIYSQADGSQAVNKLYIKSDAAWDSTSLTSLATELATWWNAGSGSAGPASGTSHLVTLTSVVARDMTTQTGHVVTFNPTTGNVGTDSDSPVELGLTFAITLRTGLAGRSQRGRVFLVGLPTGAVASATTNVMSASSANSLAAQWGTLLAFLATNPVSGHVLTWVVASFYSGVVGGKPVPRSTAQLTPVTSTGYHDLYLDFQRRRAPGHNRHK